MTPSTTRTAARHTTNIIVIGTGLTTIQGGTTNEGAPHRGRTDPDQTVNVSAQAQNGPRALTSSVILGSFPSGY